MNIASVQAASGLASSQQRFDQSAARIATAHNPIDTVSLSTQAVSLMQAKQESQGDLAVLHAGDKIEKAALSIVA
jgi:hypothetical protein